MLIFRYLAKEVFITLASLTGILMLIFMSNQFVRYLSRAANGQIPGMFILKLMLLEVPNLSALLLPLGFYIALLIAYGRLYADSEMTVLQACGYGPSQLLKHSFVMALGVAGFVAMMMIWASPVIAVERARLLRTSGVQTLIQTIVPGRFNAVSSGRQVFYVESMTGDHTKAEHVFLARHVIKDNLPHWTVLWADRAFVQTDPATQEDYVVLQQGQEYEGVPGRADYQTAQFKEYKARLAHPVFMPDKDIRTMPTRGLLPFFNTDNRRVAELQWRMSVPLMVLTLTLVAVPLSRVDPRSGKFARLLPAILLYFMYANFMFVTRDWIVSGKIAPWPGMLWLHALVAGIGLLLIWRNRANAA